MFGSCEALVRAIAPTAAARTIQRVKRLVPLVVLAFVLLGTAAAPAATSVSAKQLTTRFKKATGEKLVVNKLKTSPGAQVAYELRVQTFASKAKWGTFTVYLVTAADVEAGVTRLLADTHTGTLGRPTAAGIYWEQGATLTGTPFWMAKRRYGKNVVLTWIGNQPVKKTDASWKRLHKALVAATK